MREVIYHTPRHVKRAKIGGSPIFQEIKFSFDFPLLASRRFQYDKTCVAVDGGAGVLRANFFTKRGGKER
jgi:hypothetical protein